VYWEKHDGWKKVAMSAEMTFLLNLRINLKIIAALHYLQAKSNIIYSRNIHFLGNWGHFMAKASGACNVHLAASTFWDLTNFIVGARMCLGTSSPTEKITMLAEMTFFAL
jgi:hypothetical protein